MSKQQDVSTYPAQRDDWLMTVYYADKKIKYHCILCDKTHKIIDCPNKLTKIETDSKKYKSMYEQNEEDQYMNPHNYGW